MNIEIALNHVLIAKHDQLHHPNQGEVIQTGGGSADSDDDNTPLEFACGDIVIVKGNGTYVGMNSSHNAENIQRPIYIYHYKNVIGRKDTK